MAKQAHIAVLKKEVLHYLAPRKGDCIVDATLGLGGHAKLILKEIGPKGKLIGFEQDEKNLVEAKKNLKEFKNVEYVSRNFENLEDALSGKGEINGFLFDLGLSSPHVDDPSRGFSFQKDGPLDMRFDTRQQITAADMVNNWPIGELVKIFYKYGEERKSKIIARAIGREREKEPIESTGRLASIIEATVRHEKGRHPATRIFQALRIAVNREIDVLEETLPQAVRLLAKGGRIVVISYHSLEDRVVKHFFRDEANDCVCDKKMNPVCVCGKIVTLKVLTKKPISPSEEEIEENARARSARLRAAEKLTPDP